LGLFQIQRRIVAMQGGSSESEKTEKDDTPLEIPK
jgi:hypothetical protein